MLCIKHQRREYHVMQCDLVTLQIKGEVSTKGDDVKVKQTALDKAHTDLEPLQAKLDELRKAARGQVCPRWTLSPILKLVLGVG